RRTHCTLSYSSAHPPPLASFPTRRSSDLEGQVQHVAPRFRSIADAVDLEDAREALVDAVDHVADELPREPMDAARPTRVVAPAEDRKSTRLNSSHQISSYAVFSLRKK